MKYFFIRCIGDHGREARFPYLDENVVSYLQSLPMSDKVKLQCIISCVITLHFMGYRLCQN